MQASLLNTFRIGDWTVEPMHSRIAGLRGTHHVEPRAMDVLVALAQRAGDTVGRDELIAAVWKRTEATDESLSRCISLLRHALSDDQDEPRYIETVRKRGYRLIPPIETMQRARSDTVVSIAVLPFVNLSGDPHDEYLADGITELVIANIASMLDLRVTSRTSSMHFKGSQARVTEIARELDVSTIVQGSVLCSPSELQAVVQLIDVAADAHLFSRSHVRALADVLHVQNEIASTIARDVDMTLKSRGALCRRPPQTSLPDAYAPDALRTRLSSDLPASSLREDRIPIEVEPDVV